MSKMSQSVVKRKVIVGRESVPDAPSAEVYGYEPSLNSSMQTPFTVESI